MNRFITSLRACVLGCVLALCSSAASALSIPEPERTALADSVRTLLARASEPSDSILLLYHLFDLTPYPDRGPQFDSIYNVARRAGQTEAELDVLRQKADYYQANDSMLAAIERVAAGYPPGIDADETRVYVTMLRNSAKNSYAPNDKLVASISSQIGSFRLNPPANVTERILRLYNICGLITRVTHGDMLEKYVDELDSLIDELPSHSGSVRMLFYLRCGAAFSSNERFFRAVDADRNYLATVDRLEADYKAHGRKFCNLDRKRYYAYRRLLGNYPELSRAEITSYYKAVNDIIERNDDITAEVHESRRLEIFYFMATRQYEKAIRAIRYELVHRPDSPYRARYIKFLMEAATAINDNPTRLEAALELNDILMAQMSDKAGEKTRELQIIYDVNSLKAQNSAEALESSRERRRLMQTAFVLACVALVILIAAIIVMTRKVRQTRRMAREAAETNRQLSDERDKLRRLKGELIEARDKAKQAEQQKSNFINNMSHEVRTPLAAITEYTQLIVDCIPDSQKRYLSRFANIVELNARLLYSLVSDVLDVAALERTEMTVQKNAVDLDLTCQMAVDSVRPLLKPGVEVNFVRGAQNVEIHSDAHRITQILTNLLSNGIKFTEHGSVTLSYEADTDARIVRFYVADTGIGIPAGQEEAIFDNFHQLDSSVQGTGMGLYIVRLICRLLGATAAVDRSYHKGARFVVTLPY